MAIGSIQAMKAAGIDMSKVVVGGIDATPDGLAAIAAGDLDVTVFQNAIAQGAAAMDAAVALARDQKTERQIWVPFETGDAREHEGLRGGKSVRRQRGETPPRPPAGTISPQADGGDSRQHSARLHRRMEVMSPRAACPFSPSETGRRSRREDEAPVPCTRRMNSARTNGKTVLHP